MNGLTNRTLIGALTVLLVVAAGGLYLGLSAGDAPTGSAPGDSVSSTAASGGKGGTGDAGAPGSLSIPADVARFPALDGDSASLADYRGHVVLLNLWGTWCPPCRREIPDLVEVHEKIESRGGTVVGLAVDSGSPAEIRDFIEEFGVNYPVWHARGREVSRHYRAVGYPTTLLIDREGIIRERYLGPQTAESLMEDLQPFLGD